MQVGAINHTSMQSEQMKSSQAQSGDSVTKNIQTQIANEEQKLKNLSYNKEMSMEEKAKKRQEIQKEITELNRELRQHQIEQRKEQQEKRAEKVQETLDGMQEKKPSQMQANEKESFEGEKSLPKNHVKAVITAQSKMQEADVQKNVQMQAEQKIRVLDIEIKQDRAYGANVDAKVEEREKLQDIAINATASQVGMLYHANEQMGELVNEENEQVKTNIQNQQFAQQQERQRIKISFD